MSCLSDLLFAYTRFSPVQLEPTQLHHSISQHIKARWRLIILVFMCSRWLIASQGAGRLLRSQINWNYSQDCVPIFFPFTFDTDLMFPYRSRQHKAVPSETFFSSQIAQMRGTQSDSGTCKWVTSWFVFNPEEWKPDRRADWGLKRCLNSVKS